jgi:tetrahydromethanopterin S-methyltransferase subunit G
MENSLDALPERVEAVERKLDALSVSVDRRFNAVDKRFDAVDKRFDTFEASVNQRFEAFEKSVSEQFVEQRQYTEFAFGKLDARLIRVEGVVTGHTGRLDRIERKLDQLIDLQFRPIPRSRRSPKKS